MTERELHHLSRKELLEIMLGQRKELDALKVQHIEELETLKRNHGKETEALKKELEDAKKALQNRELVISEAGSIAIAALQLNGVFEAAQAASQQYIENIRSLNERQTSICEQRELESKAQAEQLLRDTVEKCRLMEAEAKQRAEAYWEEVSRRLQAFYDSHQELKKLLDFNPQL